jgi:hypothetical protein
LFEVLHLDTLGLFTGSCKEVSITEV